MNINKHINIAILISTFILCFISFYFLPEQLPIYINQSTFIQEYVDKRYIYIFPALNLFVYFIFVYAGKYSYNSTNKYIYIEQAQRNALSCNAMILYITMLIIYYYLNERFNIIKLVFSIIGALYLYCSTKVDITNKGSFTEIRTPWIHKSDYVFKATCKFEKIIFVVLGIINLSLIFINYFSGIFYNIITITAILSIHIYSYFVYKINSIIENKK